MKSRKETKKAKAARNANGRNTAVVNYKMEPFKPVLDCVRMLAAEEGGAR